MKTFLQPGDTVTVTATADTIGGAGVRVGVMFGFAVASVASGDPLEIVTTGVFTTPKATGSAWTEGDALYWNGTACTVTAGTGNVLVGVALAAAASADTTGTVRLNGSAPAALT